MSSSIQDIYDRIGRSQEEQRQQQRLEVGNQIAPDYDRAARIFAVEANTQLPYDVVNADLENLEDQIKRKTFDAAKYKDAVNGAPVFNEFAAAHPYHTAVLERDRENLTRLERALNPVFLGWDSGWAMTEVAEIRNRQLMNFENPDNEKDAARLAELHKFTEAGNFGAQGFQRFMVGMGQQLPIMATITIDTLDEIAIGAVSGAAIGAGVGATAGGVGALPGAVTGLGIGITRGALIGGVTSAARLERGLAYDELLGMGLDEEEARWASHLVGAANGALELTGIGAVTKRIPGFRSLQKDVVGGVIASTLSKPTFRHAAARATLMYGEGVATELATEVMQEATLMAAGEILKANERDRGNMAPEMAKMTSGEFWDRVGEIASHTFYGVALIGAAGPATNLYSDSKRSWQAKQLGAAWDAMGEAASGSETRKNAPSKYREFVEQLTGKHGNILIEARRFIDYFQEQGMDPEEVAISVGVSAEDLGAAEVGGLDISLPVGQYLEKIAPSEHHKALSRDLKSHSDQMSHNEAEAFDKHLKQTMKTMLEEAAVEDPTAAAEDAKAIEIYKQDLIKAGMSPEAAEHKSQLAVGITNMARRAGKDPMTFFNERFGGIVATTNAQMRVEKEDFDVYVDPYLDRIRAGDMPQQRDIFGPSVVDRMKALGGLAPDAELDARDIKLQVRGLIKETGDTLDGIAEILHEEGYIPTRDPNLVLDALERELGGDLVFGDQFNVKTDQQELLGQLEQLASILDQYGIDISEMSNPEVRKALEEIESFYQTDDEIETSELEALTKLAFATAQHDPNMLAKLELSLPRIAPMQDFGDVQFTDEYTLPGGQKVTRTRAANKEFEKAKKRKNVLEKLKECLGG